MKFLFLEPFFGGSHRDFAEGLAAHSRHDITLLTLPARFWKWRMRGAALYFIRHCPDLTKFDGLVTSGLMSLSDFRSLAGTACPPSLVFFHENQLSYPLSPGERLDVHFGFTDITTALAADRLVFNSQTHLESFFAHLPRFIGRMPEFKPLWVVQEIRRKAQVLYPGCHLAGNGGPPPACKEKPPVIIWNHRWEFDKNPDAFFAALEELAAMDCDFQLALLGENFQTVPECFQRARNRFQKQIIRYGHVASRKDYHEFLKRGTVVVSTARQENFGIAVVEAIHYGALPLLPNRLSYPELIPTDLHAIFLYEEDGALAPRLAELLKNPAACSTQWERLGERMRTFAWPRMIDAYDRLLDNLAGATTAD